MDEMDPVVDQGNDDELIKPELKPDSPRWYEGHISLEDAKTFIKANITTAARSFIAIGFYLKCVRDRNLFLEEDYPDVWEFAKSEYGISKSTASRYMSMNDRFSENGNSPNIQEEYRAFGKSQLQEMLYLEDDQLDQVKPGDRVEDIRNLRKPKEVPYIELPGQLDFEIDFPEILPQEQLAPMISQKQTFDLEVEELLSDAGQESVASSQQEPGEEKLSPIQRGCITGMNPYGLCVCCGYEGAECCGECEESCNGRCGWLEKTQERQTRPDQEEKQGSGKFDTTPTSCPHRGEYSCTLSEENKSVPGDGSNCGSSCCWTCAFRGMCKYECNASAGRDGKIPEYDDAAWFVREWVKYSPGDLKRVLEACSRGSTNAERAKAVQEEISPYGAHNRSCWKYDFSFHGFAGGMDFRIGKVDIHLKYGRFVQELMNLYPDFEEPASKGSENVTEEAESVPEQPETLPKSSENVIDGEFVEVPPESETFEYTPQYFLEEQKEKLDKYLRITKGTELNSADIKLLECQKTIVAALAAMVAELERPGPEPEPVKQAQPELPLLKNNDQRAAFVDAYETWPLWIETVETGERYYRYDLPDGTSIVVKVYHAMLFNYKGTGKYENRFHEGYGRHEYYLLREGKFFRDCETNRSTLVDVLKELQKKK